MPARLTALLLATATAALIPAPATAQTQSSQNDRGPELETITVTAQRYREDLQRTPVSVTALSTEALLSRQVFNIRDLGPEIPGAVVQSVVGLQNAPRIFIRGVGQDSATFNSDNAVGTYVDGIFIPRLYGALFDFADIDRVEVLRGPQGTLYGRNTAGGAIKLVTKRPTDTLSGVGEFAYGSFNQVDVKGYLSGPLISDKLAGSISILARRRDGITNAYNLGKKVNNRDVTSERGKLLFTPSDNFEVEISLDHTTDNTGPFYPTAIAGNPAVFPRANRFRDLFETDGNSPDHSRVTQDGLTLTGRYTLGNLTLTSLSGLRSVKADTIIPLDTAPNSIFISGLFLRETSFSQEFNATYQSDRFEAVGGVYYFFERARHLSPLGATQPELSKQRTNSYAAYAQGTFNVTDALGITAGVRYTDDKKFLYNFYYVPTAAIPNRAPRTGDASWDSWTPKFGIEYQATDDLLVFASYAKGFKGGGWNRIPPAIVAGQLIYTVFPYGPENSDAYEVGGKFQTADNRLRFNVSLYQNKYSGLQVSQQIPGTTIARITNASKARVRGLEIESAWQLTDWVQVYGNAAWTGGKYTESFLCQVSGVFTECRNRKLRGVIPFKGLLGVTFTPDIGLPGTLRIGASADYSDKYYNDAPNTELIAARARMLVDAIIAYDHDDPAWTLSLEVKNLFDKHYWSGGLPVLTTLVVYPNDPRTVTGRFRYRF